MADVPALRPARAAGVDVARGLASVLMIQGHAFDAWASADAKRSAVYAIESAVLQTLALPAFLVLAGASLALRIEAAGARGESAASVRRAIVMRGAQIVGVGYALNAFSALVDGWDGPETFLRADVLHVIGLSLIVLGAVGVRARRDRAPGARGTWLAATAVVMVVVPIGICPLASALARDVSGPAGWALGLFVDVPGVTRMPVVPLIAWTALGLHVTREMILWNRGTGAIAGAPEWLVARTLGRAIGMAVVFTALTWALVAIGDAPLSRAHVAVIPNAIELAGRGIAVMALGMWITPRLAPGIRAHVARLGRGSLWAYVFHVPICYGRLGAPLRGRLSLLECAGIAAALVIVSYGVVWAKDRIAPRGG